VYIYFLRVYFFVYIFTAHMNMFDNVEKSYLNYLLDFGCRALEYFNVSFAQCLLVFSQSSCNSLEQNKN